MFTLKNQYRNYNSKTIYFEIIKMRLHFFLTPGHNFKQTETQTQNLKHLLRHFGIKRQVMIIFSNLKQKDFCHHGVICLYKSKVFIELWLFKLKGI